jgi:antitoxin (DNA-binding transcriptional repressor) of toxin-antitoxin stability system
MKTATVRELKQDFAKIESWLSRGEHVLISKRGKPVMEIRPATPKQQKKPGKIDFPKVQRDLWGNRFFLDDEVESMQKLADDEST